MKLVDERTRKMRRKANIEKVIMEFREVEVLQSQGMSISESFRKLGVDEHKYYRWKKAYRRMDMDQAKRLKVLEMGNR